MDYSSTFQDNIPSFMFNSTIHNVLGWINENRDDFDWAKDPNAYEMTNLFLFGAKYRQEGKDVDIDTLTKMWDIRSHDFENCNISENNFVYAICQDAYQSMISGKAMVNDENSHHALIKMAGLGLFFKQQQRDNNTISYNNPQELLQLLQCSHSLKTFHPELFDRYAFKENIDVLCRLQFEHQLPNEIISSINTLQDEISTNSPKSSLDSSEKNFEKDFH